MIIGIIIHDTTNLPLLCNIPHSFLIYILKLNNFVSSLLRPKLLEIRVSSAPLSPYIVAKARTLMSMFPIPTPAIREASLIWPI